MSGQASILLAEGGLGVYMLEVLDAAAVRSWSRHAVVSLDAHRAEIDRLNVFPIHDSDTGTNLATTMRAARDALAADSTGDAADALQALARGAVLGACGNSGNIVAQMLRGIADVAAEAPVCDAAALRDGLRRGSVQARNAVAEPVEGTILTVAAAAAAAIPDHGVSLAEVAGLALAAATDALPRTTGQLAVLARAGVVDAGAKGLVLLLQALVRSLGGEAPNIAPAAPPRPARSAGQHRAPGRAFEVQYLLDTEADFTEESAELLRTELTRRGDSVVVVGTGDGTWSVHIHTDEAGAAVEAGISVGRPYRISVSRLDEPATPPKPGAVIAIAPGDGLGRMFETEGVRVVAGSSPSVDEVVAAMLAAHASEIVLLPNNSQIAGVAEAAADQVRERGIRVAVVPTRSPVQGLAAVAVHDPARRFDDDVVAMAEAAAATRFAEVTIAEHESLTSAGICQAGDVLGLIDGEVVEIGRGVLAVALVVTDRLLGVGAELMTVLVGAGAQHGIGDVVRRHVRERSQLTEVSVYELGELRHPLIIGVE